MTTVARAKAPMAGDRSNVDTAVTMDIGRYNKRVLLTAAGFSRNYGGRLTREMWEDIFSHPEVQRRPQLRTLLIRTPQFEDALAEAADTKIYEDPDRAALRVAIEDAFARIDAEHEAHFSSGHPIDLLGIKEFLNWFYSPTQRVGFVFSLNQDFLMERLAYHWSDLPFALPGVRYLPRSGPFRHGIPPLVAPATPDLATFNLAGNLNYIKLHGSYQWRPTDGSPDMVLGGAKRVAIGQSALLTRYHELFEKVLCAGDVRLLIVGYGFHDAHINRTIKTAVESHDARVFVWDTGNPLDLVKAITLETPAHPRMIFDLRPYLCGAASRPLSQVFPWSGHPTTEFARIKSSFLA